MKSIVVLFFLLISAQAYNAFAENINSKEQLVFREALDSYIKSNDSIFQYLVNRNPNEIVGVEVIIAAGTDSAVYSKWGHALLRFVDNDGIWSNDITLNFVALVNTPKLSLFKGVTGGYEVLPEIKTLYDFWLQYVQTEDRSLERYIIPTTPELVKKLLATLKSWREDSSKLGNYKFIGNNCVGVLSKLLSESGIIPSHKKAIVPTNFGTKLDEMFLSPFEKLVVKSPFYILPKVANLLDISPDELLNGTSWPNDATEKLFANLSNDELMFLYQSVPLLPDDVSSAILKKINDKTNSKNFKSFLGFAPVPETLYHMCFDKTCANQIFKAERKLWGAKNSLERRSKRITTFFQSNEKSLKINSDQIISYQNIIDTQIALGDYAELLKESMDSLLGNTKINTELRYMNGDFYLKAYTKDEAGETLNIVDEKLKTGIFEIQNNLEVIFEGKIVGKIIKKNIGSDFVQFYSPYGLVHRVIDDKGIAIGFLAPSLQN